MGFVCNVADTFSSSSKAASYSTNLWWIVTLVYPLYVSFCSALLASAGVSINGDLVCVADINRMTSQRHRGGGGFCAHLSGLQSSLNGIITSATTCSGAPAAAQTTSPDSGGSHGWWQAQTPGASSASDDWYVGLGVAVAVLVAAIVALYARYQRSTSPAAVPTDYIVPPLSVSPLHEQLLASVDEAC
eukprot:m.839451 g.839451  ORF g.839451 m.839451 type:complete len:188 (+) comp23466_c0_seq26:912-1475(+)